jgi:hypothetical protein
MKKVLLLGSTQANFMTQLYSNLIKLEHCSFDIYILATGEEQKLNKYNFPHTIISGKIKLSFFEKIKLFVKVLYKISLYEFVLDLRVRGIKRIPVIFKEKINALAIYEFVIKKQKFDLIHLFYLYKNDIIYFLPPKQKVIVSVWGSDLFRHSGLYNYYYHLKTAKRADLITIHSVEMKEVFLAKFGRQFEKKIKIALFPQETLIYQSIKEVSEQDVLNFKKKFGIPNDKIIISIGHNAKRENNQFKIVRQLAGLDNNIKEQIICIFPLNYGNEHKEEFADELLKYCRENNIKAYVFTDFFDVRKISLEYAAFRKMQNIVIQMLISDALSHYITEAMYAGSIVITGAWLPYGPFRRAGLKFYELERIDDLKYFIEKIINEKLINFVPKIKKQQEAIERVFFPKNTTKVWKTIYKEIFE